MTKISPQSIVASLPAPRAAQWAQRVRAEGRLLPAALGIEEPLGLRRVPEKAVRALEKRWDAHAARFALEPAGKPLSAPSRHFVEYAFHQHVPAAAWDRDLGAFLSQCADDTLRLIHGVVLLFDFFREEGTTFVERHPRSGDGTTVTDFFHDRISHCVTGSVIGLHLLRRTHGTAYGVLNVPAHVVITVPYREGRNVFANNAMALLPPFYFQQPGRATRDGYVRLGKERAGSAWTVLGHVYNNSAALCWMRDQHTLGLAMIRQALGIEPRSAYAWINAHLFLLGDPDKAQACLREALHVNPHDPRAHTDMAWLLFDRGSHAAARLHCQTATKHEPTYADAHYLLGLIFIRQGNRSAARARFNRVLQLQPEHERAQKALGDMARKTADGSD